MKAMKATTTFVVLCAADMHSSIVAFQLNPHRPNLSTFHRGHTVLSAALATASSAKQNLLTVAERLKASDGVLLVDSQAKTDLTKAVAELEAAANPPTQEDYESKFKGDWTLLCSTAVNANGLDTSKIPFLNQGPLKSIREYINRSLKVEQRIRCMTESGMVDRIDHVLEYQPPDTLKQLLDNLPDALTSLNINPLHVSQGNVTLIHKAQVESVTPVLRTKLSLESIVLSAAGKTQFLDPNGSDLVGINVPLGEFLNAGSFDTTYMDDDIRVSRGKLGVVEQLRVFIRSDQASPFTEEVPDVDLMGENVGEVVVGGADDETEQAVSDSNFEVDDTDDATDDEGGPKES